MTDATVVGPAIVGGSMVVETKIYRATYDNRWVEDISRYCEPGQLRVDTTQEIMSSYSFNTIRKNTIDAYNDWIAPVMSIDIPDPDGQGHLITERQLGLFCVPSPSFEFDFMNGADIVDAQGPLYRLANSGPGYAFAIASGQNVVTRMRTICSLARVRALIQSSSETQPKRRAWEWNATWLQILNDLGKSIGFVPMWEDSIGRVRSHRFKSLHSVEPAHTFSNENKNVVDPPFRLTPDLERLCNYVVVVGNNPKTNTPITKSLLNNSKNSPTSTVNLGTPEYPFVIPKFEEDSNLETQAAVNDRAELLMERGSSVMFRVDLITIPMNNWEVGQTIRLDLETSSGEDIGSGTWRWESLSMGTGIDCEVNWTLAKLIKWEDVYE